MTAAGRDVMRAIVQDVYGSADRLRLSEIERPVIAADEVLVQVRAAGVDRGTCHLMRGEPYLVRILGFGSAGRRTASPDVIRAVRHAARDTDAEYQALLARRREHALREAQAQRERQADPARRGRLAEDQARIDAVLAETEQ